jgi:hypothetical protein
MKTIALLLVSAATLLFSACASGPVYGGAPGPYPGPGPDPRDGYYWNGAVYVEGSSPWHHGYDNREDENRTNYNERTVNDTTINRTNINDRTVNQTDVNRTNVNRRNIKKTNVRRNVKTEDKRRRTDQDNNQ